MNIGDYQHWTGSMGIYPKELGIIYCALGLSNETGEVLGKLKKLIRDVGWDVRDKDGIDLDSRERLLDELGDVAWYLVRLCDELGFEIEAVLDKNFYKLEKRKKMGTIGGEGDER